MESSYASQICACATGNIHVRSEAGTAYPTIGYLSPGECHEDEGGRKIADGIVWTRIHYNEKIGWAATHWLTFEVCRGGNSSGCPYIISRAGWGARIPFWPVPKLTQMPTYVIIHHGETPGCHTKEQCIQRVQAYQNYHMDTHNWPDIGFNYIVGEDGNIYEGRGWDEVGAHTKGHNYDGIGICIIGDFKDHLPNNAALTAVKNLIQCGHDTRQIRESYIIQGHRDVTPTDCPGDKLYDLIQTWPHYHKEN